MEPVPHRGANDASECRQKNCLNGKEIDDCRRHEIPPTFAPGFLNAGMSVQFRGIKTENCSVGAGHNQNSGYETTFTEDEDGNQFERFYNSERHCPD